MSWASGPGLSAGPTKQGHSVLSELTNSEPNQPWKWKSSSFIRSWFSPARLKLFNAMEDFAALALAPVLEDHWQHSMPLFHSFTSQRIEQEKKKIKEKSQLFGDTRLNQCYFNPAGICIHWNAKLAPPSQDKQDKDDSGQLDVILTSKAVILMFDYCWVVSSAIRGQIQTGANEERTLSPGRAGRNLRKPKKTDEATSFFLWLKPDL